MATLRRLTFPLMEFLTTNSCGERLQCRREVINPQPTAGRRERPGERKSNSAPGSNRCCPLIQVVEVDVAP